MEIHKNIGYRKNYEICKMKIHKIIIPFLSYIIDRLFNAIVTKSEERRL